MVQVDKHYLPPTPLIPNSPFPLLHYKGVLSAEARKPENIHELTARNGWKTQWIFRYDPTQDSHYHSQAHECMAVLTGTATIRFGVADTSPDKEANTHGPAKEEGGIEVFAQAGDVFILPAGTAHKTMSTTKGSTFKLLTPGCGHGIAEDHESAKEELKKIELSGYTMMGCYPVGQNWDFAVGGENTGEYEKVWSVPKPEADPILGKSRDGIVGQWIDTKAKL